VPARLAVATALLLIAALLAGCGSSSDEGSTGGATPPPAPGARAPVGAAAKSCEAFAADAESLRATNISCEQARQVMYGWQREPDCALPATRSRGGCLTRSYRCQATQVDRGIAVSCSRAGESVAFIARRG